VSYYFRIDMYLHLKKTLTCRAMTTPRFYIKKKSSHIGRENLTNPTVSTFRFYYFLAYVPEIFSAGLETTRHVSMITVTLSKELDNVLSRVCVVCEILLLLSIINIKIIVSHGFEIILLL
jgi:hypothetical protein